MSLLEALPSTPTLSYTPQVALATAAIAERVRSVIPPVEWPLHAPYVAAIAEWKRRRNAVVLAHNYQTPEIYHGSPTSPAIPWRWRSSAPAPRPGSSFWPASISWPRRRRSCRPKRRC